MSEMKHATGTMCGGEMTMCGIAFDAGHGESYSSSDLDEPVIFAKSGQRVTCPDCRQVIDHARKFKGYIEP